WRDTDPRDLTRQSLRYLYRIIVLLFAEARPELGILPADDPDYQSGYSMARLRDTALVELHSDHARNARHLQHSLDVLFRLVNVYEGLMAYSGFLATEPLFEVDKDGDPDNGSWVIAVNRADEFPDDVFLTEEALDGSTKRVRYEEGDFVFRLSGRDRQRSAS